MKIFQINNFNWWMAPSRQAAIKGYYGANPGKVKEPREVTSAEMRELKVETADGKVRTFRAELKHRIKKGAKSELFACEES